MPWREPDPEDPMKLVGVSLPADATSLREMACVFAEEFARMGHGEKAILALFRRSFYAGAHDAWRRLGEPEVRKIVAETVSVWGRARVSVRDGDPLQVFGAGGDPDD